MEGPCNHIQLQRWCVSCDSSVVQDMGCENGNLSPCCCDQSHRRTPSLALRSPREQSRHYCPAHCRGWALQDEIKRTAGSACVVITKSAAGARKYRVKFMTCTHGAREYRVKFMTCTYIVRPSKYVLHDLGSINVTCVVFIDTIIL